MPIGLHNVNKESLNMLPAMRAVLFFSSDDWSDDLKTSKYHMATCLANDGYRVLYINSIGLKQQSLGSQFLKKVFNRLKTVFKGLRHVNANLYVFTPFILPFHSSNIVSRLNQLILVLSVRLLQYRLNISEPELWVFLPNHVSLIGKFNERVALYYCVDEHTLFSGVDTSFMHNLEEKLIKHVNLVVVTAKPLYESKKLHANNILYLPHGVNVEHFSQAVVQNFSAPDDIARITGPKIGFFGLIEDWIDLDLVAYAALELPTYSFIMLGKIKVNIENFAPIKNMKFLGPKPFGQLPQYCRHFDCAIMPFKINAMTLNVNPLKMREYLAAGLPVVSTALPEAQGQGSYVRIARRREEFVTLLSNTIETEVDRRAISSSVTQDSWEGRYRQLRNEIGRIAPATILPLI
ncbi:MAG: glycosyltransferase [Gammaproteobacteria bacterium]|nr:glycosyltransferase [Gammaproteobacteria bacterium]